MPETQKPTPFGLLRVAYPGERNTGLRPWKGDNYDLSLEYYTANGGLISGGVFMKEVTGFFGSQVKIATEEDLEALGLDPGYEGWELTTQFNLPGTSQGNWEWRLGELPGAPERLRELTRIYGRSAR